MLFPFYGDECGTNGNKTSEAVYDFVDNHAVRMDKTKHRASLLFLNSFRIANTGQAR